MKEKASRTTRDNLKTAVKVAAGVAIVFSGAMAFRQDQVEGKAPTIPDYSHFDFKPITIDNGINKDSMNIGDRLTVVFSSPSVISSSEISLSPQEQKIQGLQNETAGYVQIAQESGKVSDKWINDLKMYGPIYIAVAEKFGIDWKMLWITHEMESGASAKDSKAFDGSTYPYVGGMQRNQKTWSDEFVKEAFSSLEYLNSIPTNHHGDAQEIAGAAAIMAPNMELYGELGKEKAIFNTSSLFTGSKDSAQKRLDMWIIADDIFSNKKIPLNFVSEKAVQ